MTLKGFPQKITQKLADQFAHLFPSGSLHRHLHELPKPAKSSDRRYDLDWLRVIVILNLIPFHVVFLILAIPGFSEVATHTIAAQLAGIYLLAISPLHMPLMFAIAGYSTTLALQYKPFSKFVRERVERLLIPLIGLTLLVMPIAAYSVPSLSKISVPIQRSFADYWIRFLPEVIQKFWSASVVNAPLWLHLWFVLYLIVITAFIAPILNWLKPKIAQSSRSVTDTLILSKSSNLSHLYPSSWLARIGTGLWWGSLFGFMGGFFLAFNTPFYQFNLIHDRAYFFYNLVGFCLGISLYAIPQLETRLNQQITALTITAIASLILRLGLTIYSVKVLQVDLPELYVLRLPFSFYCLYAIVAGLNTWSTLLSLWGWAKRYLNRPSSALTYLSDRSYSYYILHFLVTCCAGVWIVPLRLNFVAEFSLLCLATAIGTVLADELLIRPWALGRWLFGVKSQQKLSKIN